jgi:hypothetical protein
MVIYRALVLLLTIAILSGSAISASAATAFGQNEMRAALIRDRLRTLWDGLRDGSAAQKQLKAQADFAFRGEPDQTRAVEAYDALRQPMIVRLHAIERKLDAAMAGNDLDDPTGNVRKQADALSAATKALCADYDFYAQLPGLASGPRRAEARASMRLLSQNGQYAIARSYYASRGLRPGSTPAAAPNAFPFLLLQP